ncbi:fibronectin type III domain-containing protein [Haloferula sp. A504]|uniref:fibronectin type III domain-containing protein n=1 Tax=Haloferula sp. A504 TaxID=3373601 RepID=UPI0031BEA80A|nr:fibronectin type III domain-containing protein [Verrucomicrobiaceae bacterium E54]
MPASAQETLKVFLLAGQSNMEGQAYTYDNASTAGWNIPTLEFLLSGTPAATNYLANMPHSFKASLDSSWTSPRSDAWCVHYDSSNGNLKAVAPSTDPADNFTGFGPLSPGFGVGVNFGSMFGAELGMGIRLGDATTDPIVLFKSDKGGTTLAEDWRPPSAVAARGGVVGPNYTNTVNRFSAFLDDLDADLLDDGTLNNSIHPDEDPRYGNATSYEICGLVWIQGYNEVVENGGAFITEYEENLIDFTYDIRSADTRIPADLPVIVLESSDQNAAMNTARTNAVATLNAGIPGSAVFHETENMIEGNPGSVFWGNNELGSPFTTDYGFHFHARAENFLEMGWIVGGAVLDNSYLESSDFWLTRPGIGAVQFNQADVSSSVNAAADTLTVYWGTTDPGATTAGWDQSASLASQSAGAIASTLTGLQENTTYFVRLHATNTALGQDFISAPNTFTTPLEFPVPVLGAPVTNSVNIDGASVECTLSMADADVTLVWAEADQGATTIGDWTSAPGGGSQAFPGSIKDTVISHTITGLSDGTSYSYRFFASAASGDDWSEAGSFTTLPLEPLVQTRLVQVGGSASSRDFDVSVFDGAAGYAGQDNSNNPTSGTFGDGTVLDYRFFNETATPDVIGTYAQGSGNRISNLTTTDTGLGNQGFMDLWTTTAGFATPADFTANTMLMNSFDNGAGTIDISGLASGKIYFIYGAYRSDPEVDLTMSDNEALVSNIELLNAGKLGRRTNNDEFYVLEISFLNDSGYDLISFNYSADNGRFAGVVLDGTEATGSDPFNSWATSGTVTGVTFEGDANGDGIQDGMAFLLGASSPDQNATGLLPATSTDGSGGLQMSFTMLKPDNSAPAVLSLEHSGDLGVSDAWASVDVPGSTSIVGGVDFNVSENAGDSTKNDVVATIPSAGNASNGKLFGRLAGQ